MDVLRAKYRLERKLGQGGMGEVWAATHVGLGQKVAVKRMLARHAEGAQQVARFLREARTAATLTSDHAVRIIDVDEAEDGTPFFVMELLEGEDLETLLAREGPLDAARAAKLMLEACEGLAQAHARGIVHRDIKPANLFLAKRPNKTSLVKLLDFGISKSVDEHVQITTTQTVIGSPVYMSPEQIRASRDVDARTDIWSLGIVLAQLVTGKLPFTGTAATAVAAAITADPPMLEGVPEVLLPTIARCLEKRPEDRFPNIVALAVDLARVLGDESLADPVRAIGSEAAPAELGLAPTIESRRTESLEIVKSTEGASATGRSVSPLPPSKPRRWVIALVVALVLGVPLALLLRPHQPRPRAPAAPPIPSSAPVEIAPVVPSAPPPTASRARDAGVRAPSVVTATKPRDPLEVDLK